MPTENRSSNTEMVSVPREHELKIRQTPLADLLSGLKTGEVRDCSDREFTVGDTVLLREIDGALYYTGTVARRTITHVQKNFGLPDHLCVLSYAQPAEQHQVDHSEVERLRSELIDKADEMRVVVQRNEGLIRRLAERDAQVDALAAQVVERGVMLRQGLERMPYRTDDQVEWCTDVRALLNASAEPEVKS